MQDGRDYKITNRYARTSVTPYCDKFDQFWIDSNNTGVLIYEGGKWAEILPSKKPLPKTKEGIALLIEMYHNQNDGLPFKTPVDEFLSQYE